VLTFGPLAFAQPWLLLVLAGLPIIWLLLRVMPPAPRRLQFPAIRLLFGLHPPEETPARTPPWLLALRLTIAALIVVGLAGPLLDPLARLAGSGPLVLVVDDDWAAARDWTARQSTLEALLERAGREARPVVIAGTARDALDQPPLLTGLLTAAEAAKIVRGMTPKPWPADRPALTGALAELRLDEAAEVLWLSDGIDDGNAFALAESLRRLGRVTLLREPDARLARMVLPPETVGGELVLRLRRATGDQEDLATLLAGGEDGLPLASVPVSFAPGETEARVPLQLPTELRNRLARVSIENERSAGAVFLLDERWRRRPVGLVAAGPLDGAQPLLSELYYLRRALDPFTELRQGTIDELLQRELAILVLPDSGPMSDAEAGRLAAWVEGGGLLLRFAGLHLAERTGTGIGVTAEEPLLPVRLRGGDRTLTGALTWDTPAHLAAFGPNSPFYGLHVPEDVVVRRQVLAEPSLDLGEKTWARLSDGTPLVTAESRGQGWVVLVHTTANTDWSSLPLSGLFVEMLQRLVAVSQGVAGAGDETRALPPIETLDGFGVLGPPAPTTLAVPPDALAAGAVGPRHPPGYYGDSGQRRAHNLAAAAPALAPIARLPGSIAVAGYVGQTETDLTPWLLTAALILLLADFAIALYLRGLLGSGRILGHSGAAALLLAALLWPGDAAAQSAAAPGDDARALAATLQTRLAYVITGVPALDEVSRAGLSGLTRVLYNRTSIEAGEPMGVDPARDELAFFPLLYWPITPEQRDLPEIAERKINAFLRNGGTILFDLREAGSSTMLGQSTRNGQALQRLTRGLDIPSLAPVPPDHVLTKSFYLMQEFPGRFSSGTLWIETTESRTNDGVASVLIGSNDWAGAWAVDEFGRPLFPVVPGGERQREFAYRFGVNLMMYAMTGNYKADQVHVPFILERLGQ